MLKNALKYKKQLKYALKTLKNAKNQLKNDKNSSKQFKNAKKCLKSTTSLLLLQCGRKRGQKSGIVQKTMFAATELLELVVGRATQPAGRALH